MKKLLIILLILTMLSSMLVACKQDGDKVPPTVEGEDTTFEDDFQLSVEGLDYGKKEVVIHVRGDDECVKEIGVENDNTALSAELVERTMVTEERLNILITIAKGESWSNYSQTISELRNSIHNGLGEYDIIAGWSPRIPVLSAEGLFYDLNQFDYFDSQEKWWSQSLVESLTFNGKLHFATGDISSQYMDGAYVLLFNQVLAEARGMDYAGLYNTVEAGDWTIDYLWEITKDVYVDQNGSSTRDKEDIFGLVAEAHTNLQCFWGSSGINIMPNNGVDRPEIDFDVQQIQGVFDKVYNLFHNNNGAVINNVEGLKIELKDKNDTLDFFKEGKALFYIVKLGDLSRLTDMTQDYGILPTPKYDAEQKQYHTHLHACTLFGVPMDAKDPEMSAAIMTSLAYDSNQIVIIPHFEKLLKLRYSKDTESGKMIDLIYNNIYMNFDSIYNEALGTNLSDKTSMPIFAIPTLIQKNDGTSIASWWQTNKSNLQSKFEAIMDGFFDE